MKTKKMKLMELTVKSFTTSLEAQRMKTIKAGEETTPDPTPITTTDKELTEPLKTAFTDCLCPAPSGYEWC